MRGIHLFIFIILIPAIAALGHDIYLFTQDNAIEALPEALQDEDRRVQSFFADLGFIWTEYHPESYKQTVETLEPEQWAVINRVLAHKAVLVALAFAAIIYAFLFLLKILRVWPFRESKAEQFSSNKRVDEIMGRGGSQKFKYKRK